MRYRIVLENHLMKPYLIVHALSKEGALLKAVRENPGFSGYELSATLITEVANEFVGEGLDEEVSNDFCGEDLDEEAFPKHY